MRAIKVWPAEWGALTRALVVSNLLAGLLFVIRVAVADNFRYGFLFWNLLLAAVPLWLAWRLRAHLATNLWSAPISLLLTGLWLVFFPNSFYLLSDLMHLRYTGEVSLHYDIALFSILIFNACAFGFMSVFIVHKELIKRVGTRMAHRLVGGVFLLCGFAIYLGRYLRWNTWDVVVNPFGLLFDISEHALNPTEYPQMFVTTLVFAALLSAIYWVIWSFSQTAGSDKRA
jgi:uncharacterized membrane protein